MRAVLAALLGCLLNAGAAEAQSAAAPPQGPSLPCYEYSNRAHVAGASIDVGGGRWTPGLRYVHGHFDGGGCYQVGGFGWLAYGVDLRMHDLEAGAAYALGRAGYSAHPAGGLALEIGFGGGTDGAESGALGFVTLLWSVHALELGAIYHVPIGSPRPDWLGRWQFAVRLNIPVWTYANREKRFADPDRAAPQ